MQRPRALGEAVIRAPPALDLSTLAQNDLQTIVSNASDIELESLRRLGARWTHFVVRYDLFFFLYWNN